MRETDNGKVYYELLMDSYGQPGGGIVEVHLTDEEYEASSGTHFLYRSYAEAVARMMD